MTRDLANIVKGMIDSEVWVDRISGIVRPQSRAITGAKGTPIIQTFPVSCDVPDAECDDNMLKDLVPNSERRSIIYFEDQGVGFIGTDGPGFRYQARFRLVAWLNLRKFESAGCDLSGLITHNILSLISELPINSGPYLNTRITPIGMPAKLPNIFSPYTYRETEKQFLMHPYDYFAIDFKAEFTMNANCIDLITLSDEPC